MRVISRSQLEQTLDMQHCIGLMKEALAAISSAPAEQVLRQTVPLHGHNLIGLMPAYSPSRKVAGVKVLSVFPGNYLKGVPSHQGLMIVFETTTGSIKALVDAEALTGIRTAAVSAVATEALSRSDACHLAILGAGVQGRQHLRAIRLVRDLREVTVWDVHPDVAAAYSREIGEETGLTVKPCSTAAEATAGADIICTVTPSREPILYAADVAPGAHINAVGACTPDARELASDIVASARLFVDWKPAAIAESGDYLLALKDGAISDRHILGEVGEVLSGATPGRIAATDITIFEALGQALEDLIAADAAADILSSEEG